MTRAEGARWYGVVYRTAYVLGLRLWDREAPTPDLVELAEGPAAVPPGRALDIGCGTGTDSIYLARHGWEVTGVDMVPRALALARRRAAAAGVTPRFVEGDVTRLAEHGVGHGYDLLLDFGCFHTLPADRRDAYVESVSGAAAPGATLLLCGFTRPPRLAPMRAGVTTEEVRERFGSGRWELVSGEPMTAQALRVRGDRVDARFGLWRYRLRCRPAAEALTSRDRERVDQGQEAALTMAGGRPASVLFVCVHNAGRSQMAAGLLAHLGGDRVTVRSAGSAPADEIDPSAVRAMAELGIDLSREFPKPLRDEHVQAADVVITMGCGDACPFYPGKRYEDWEVDDPAGKGLDEVRRIRDDIAGRVRGLLATLASG